jgi:hypothetical protein
MKAALLLSPLLVSLAGWDGGLQRCDKDPGGASANEPAASAAAGSPAAPGGKPVQAKRPAGPLRATYAGEMCVTSGEVGKTGQGRMRIDGPKMRAVAPAFSGDVGELRFFYRGKTEEVAPLASGQIRQQVGLKLRAKDGCNLVYVMWRIDPKPGIEVQVKSNPGKRVHKECGTRGYLKRTARRSTPVPPLVPGSEHRLRAEIKGQELVVSADGEVVWEGDLGTEARDLTGPVGIRSDNVALDFALLGGPTESGTAAKVAGGCDSVSAGD